MLFLKDVFLFYAYT